MALKKMTNIVLHKMVLDLTDRILVLEKRLPPMADVEGSLEKVETHHNPPSALSMNRGDVVVSMRNALVILNPKLKDDETGRHSLSNVSALVGKKHKITEEMMDEAYELIKEEA